jgi:hypothetical protein
LPFRPAQYRKHFPVICPAVAVSTRRTRAAFEGAIEGSESTMTSAFTQGKMALATVSAKYDRAIHANPLSIIAPSTRYPLKRGPVCAYTERPTMHGG